jgi:hypothetical protein
LGPKHCTEESASIREEAGMEESILLGRGEEMVSIPRGHWEEHLSQVPTHTEERLQFMTDLHHLVRYFVVRELVLRGKPITPLEISRDLEIDLERVLSIVEDLEKQLFFLVRNEAGEVIWAFPVTVEKTPHRLVFQSGEKLYAA